MDFRHSSKAQEYIARLTDFMLREVYPHETDYRALKRSTNPGADWTSWQVVPLMEQWKSRPRAEGLWNLFLPDTGNMKVRVPRDNLILGLGGSRT